jgi:hypothetical protein
MHGRLAFSMWLLLVLVLSSEGGGATQPCAQGTPYRNCRACGTASDARGQTLDVQKNRDQAATSPKTITVAEIRDPQNNTGHFTPDMQVEVTAYVASVEVGGWREACNCKRKDLRDIHINVVADPQEVGHPTKYVVVEFTPRWQQQFGLDDSNYQKMLDGVKGKIAGKWVTFRGWMLFDYFHADASESTSPHKPGNWRATPWEVHPVTSYEVRSGPPAAPKP